MGLAAIFNVFKQSSLVTKYGEFKISRVFPTCKAAKKARYYYYHTDNGTMIFSHCTKSGLWKYAIIGE